MNKTLQKAVFSVILAANSLHAAEDNQQQHQMMLLGGGVSICTTHSADSCLAAAELPTTISAEGGEQVLLQQTKDPFSRDLMPAFVRTAAAFSKHDQPKVLVVTASSANPFGAVDFYLQLFEQAGAQVAWLPIHNAYQQAQRLGAEQGCSQLDSLFAKYHGLENPSGRYPELMAYQRDVCLGGHARSVAMIEAADAIFFNGGDQSRTLLALRTEDGQASPELTAIQRGLAEGRLLVGGTSAGTAVMSGSATAGVPMITNGESRHALAFGAHATEPPERDCDEAGTCPDGLHASSLTYNPQGGVGLFPWGILDTHFSERGREGRLIKLALATQTRFGFGVDEATALLVSVPVRQPNEVWFEVQGKGGVFIADLASANQHRQDSSLTIDAVTTHYLTHGDRALLRDGELSIQFADWKQAVSERQAEPLLMDKVLQQDHFKQLAHQLCISDQPYARGQDQLAAIEFSLQLSRSEQSQSKQGVIVKDEQAFSFCSYQHLVLALSATLNP
ncbi:cyanophycinase [Alkalimonas sp. MEB108]|uniref:Cyanophycinase n=1 Tax=Alkalimonas cellulosilytica TaxID=3058395 RepID=A0ABU7J5F7_9GAMM|nr:cyanophycinase [Alkalimonas sp. MEB108]MEE2001738.1 cyanophycinase [Alkalimonas sp. MEB108]